MKFLTRRITAECILELSFEFLRKMQKRIYLGNEILAATLNFGGN